MRPPVSRLTARWNRGMMRGPMARNGRDTSSRPDTRKPFGGTGAPPGPVSGSFISNQI